MCMEFWCGWFAHWGRRDVPRPPQDAAAALREILECGASVNLYMAHGGTSFGGWAGANRAGELHDGELEPTVTSYDYEAPIDERGRPTEKFWRFREVLAEYADGPLPELPEPVRALAAPVPAVVAEWAPAEDVLECLGGPEVTAGVPATFEELGVDRGVVRYRVEVPGPRGTYPLRVRGLRDRAVVSVDGVRGPVLEDEDALVAEVAGPASVELWVESLGRVNYGPRLAESKGITGGLLHERQYLHGVRARGLRLDALEDAGARAAIPFRCPTGRRRSGGRGFLPGHSDADLPPGGRRSGPAGLDPRIRLDQRLQSGPVLARRPAARPVRARPGAARGRERAAGVGTGERTAPHRGRGGVAGPVSLRGLTSPEPGDEGAGRAGPPLPRHYSSRTSKVSSTNSAFPSSPTLRSPTHASPSAGAVNS